MGPFVRDDGQGVVVARSLRGISHRQQYAVLAAFAAFIAIGMCFPQRENSVWFRNAAVIVLSLAMLWWYGVTTYFHWNPVEGVACVRWNLFGVPLGTAQRSVDDTSSFAVSTERCMARKKSGPGAIGKTLYRHSVVLQDCLAKRGGLLVKTYYTTSEKAPNEAVELARELSATLRHGR